jgi:hypothetical protein
MIDVFVGRPSSSPRPANRSISISEMSISRGGRGPRMGRLSASACIERIASARAGGLRTGVLFAAEMRFPDFTFLITQFYRNLDVKSMTQKRAGFDSGPPTVRSFCGSYFGAAHSRSRSSAQAVDKLDDSLVVETEHLQLPGKGIGTEFSAETEAGVVKE